MPQVLLAKAARYPIGSTIVHRSGETIEVDAADMDKLREMGVVADPTPAEAPAPAAVEVESVAEGNLEPDATSGGDYPPLPKKTAPLSEWKEYARVNDIKLTGLTKKPEIVGYITKVVNA